MRQMNKKIYIEILEIKQESQLLDILGRISSQMVN